LAKKNKLQIQSTDEAHHSKPHTHHGLRPYPDASGQRLKARQSSTFTERMKNYIIPSLLISVALVLSAYLLSASIRDHANALRESGSKDRKVEFDLSDSMKTLIWGQRRRTGGGIPVYVEPSSSIHLIEE
jgi:hypothetical protein